MRPPTAKTWGRRVLEGLKNQGYRWSVRLEPKVRVLLKAGGSWESLETV